MSGQTPLTGLGIADAVRVLAGKFTQAGLESGHDDARTIVMAIAGIDRVAFIRDSARPLTQGEAQAIEEAMGRRLAREPVTRVVGRRGFWTLDLDVVPHVLDPRADTETLVEALLDYCSDRRARDMRILDLGTGSGALLLAILSEFPKARGIGVDLSPDACQAATANAAKAGLSESAEIRQARWFEGLTGTFDIIVSNPPYIPSGAIQGLDEEVRNHDPLLALDGGPDGLEAYREILRGAPAYLSEGGVVALELGIGQEGDVTAIAREAGLQVIACRRDLGGVPRALLLNRAT